MKLNAIQEQMRSSIEICIAAKIVDCEGVDEAAAAASWEIIKTLIAPIETQPSQHAEDLLRIAAPDLLEICQRIIKNCAWGSGSRHTFADGKGGLAGCSLSREDVIATMAAITLATGKPVDMSHAAPPKEQK